MCFQQTEYMICPNHYQSRISLTPQYPVPMVTASCVFPMLLLTAQLKSQHQEDVDQAVSNAGRPASHWGEHTTDMMGLP